MIFASGQPVVPRAPRLLAITEGGAYLTRSVRRSLPLRAGGPLPLKETSMRRITLVTVSVLLLLASHAVSPAHAQSSYEHDIVGTWSLNLIRSSFEPGPGPQALTRSFGFDDNGFLISSRATVTQNGNPSFSLVAAKIDGQDYPVWADGSLYNFITDETLPGATASLEAPDDRTLLITQKNGEGEVSLGSPNRWEVSADGNTLTVTTMLTTADGERVHNVEVFDRVSN
jgi:hypothetical protein